MTPAEVRARKWLNLECIPAVLLVVLVWPLNIISGPYTVEAVLVYGADVFASGDMAAIGFCLLIPLMYSSRKALSVQQNNLYLQTVISLVLCAGFYLKSKFHPVMIVVGSELTGDLVVQSVIYSFCSVAIAFYTITTAYRVRISISK